jgi:superfamily II DNA or RNA helicase
LLAQTGPILYNVSNKLLVDRGISVPPEVHIIKIDKPQLPAEGLTWAKVQSVGVVKNTVLNNAAAEKAVSFAESGEQILVLVEQIVHGEILRDLILSRTTKKVVYLTGKEDGETREKVFEQHRLGAVQILIATTILDEGVDIPSIDVLILAAGGKAKIRLLQRVGRGLRNAKGKTRLVVIDFANFCHPWLIKHSLQRLRTYRAEECFDIHMMPL